MAQLHFYIPDDIADKIKIKAEHAHLSVSKYLADLAKKEVEPTWPDNYFEQLGTWQGEPLQRPDQSTIEQRDRLS